MTIDPLRLASDLGRIAQRLERTDPHAAIALQAVIRRLNEGGYRVEVTSVGEAVGVVVDRISPRTGRKPTQPRA